MIFPLSWKAGFIPLLKPEENGSAKPNSSAEGS